MGFILKNFDKPFAGSSSGVSGALRSQYSPADTFLICFMLQHAKEQPEIQLSTLHSETLQLSQHDTSYKSACSFDVFIIDRRLVRCLNYNHHKQNALAWFFRCDQCLCS